MLPLLLATAVSGHLCFISPPQRGGLNSTVNTPAANLCGLTTGPCGGAAADANNVSIFSRKATTEVTFMKNLNHFNTDSPGKFEVRLMHSGNEDGDLLATVPDTKDDAPHLYIARIPWAKTSATHKGVLQVTYTTNNPMAPAVFYQCADVQII